jgi:histidinol-phosphate aminotransferase
VTAPADAALPAALAALVSAPLRGTAAYHVPAPAVVHAKLDANELPVGLPEELRAGLAAALAGVTLERYPDAAARPLRARIAAQLGVAGEQLVFGNGSDELILMLCEAFAAPRPGATTARVLYPVPSFVYYRLACNARGLAPVEVPLAADFTLDLAAIEAAIASHAPNVALFALPNNPTGTLWPMAQIAELARRHPDLIVVSDEAYHAYSGQTLLASVAELPNLVVMRTLSKLGLAGLRVGYLAASPAVAAVVDKVRPPYNLGTLNQTAACWLLDHASGWIAAATRAVLDERAGLATALAALPGVSVFPSEANLLLIRIAGAGRAHAVWQALQDRGVLVRDFDRPGPLAGCLRITVGTAAQNALLLAELGPLLS